MKSVCVAIQILSFFGMMCHAFNVGVNTPFLSKEVSTTLSTQYRIIQTTTRTITSTTRTKLYSTSSTTVKDITKNSEEKMIKSIDSVKTNLLSIRTGRASASILDRVRVEYYGTLTPLNQLASISVPSSQQLQIDPYDKSIINAIERSIVDSDIGLSPSGSDGSTIRINIPPLTEQRRKEMLKLCKAIGEEGKVAVRNIRRDGVDNIKKLEKSGTVGEDEMKDGLDTIQKLTDKKVKEIDDIVTKKEKEVMTV
jgi:ribosome recycling factor